MSNNPEKFNNSAEANSDNTSDDLFEIIIDLVECNLEDGEIEESIRACIVAQTEYLDLGIMTEADIPTWIQTAKKLKGDKLTKLLQAARVIVSRRELEAHQREKAAEAAFEAAYENDYDDWYAEAKQMAEQEAEYRENLAEQEFIRHGRLAMPPITFPTG